MKIKFSQPIEDSINPNRHSWIAFERGIHSDSFTSVAVKRGIDPIFLELIDNELRKLTPPREILRLIKERDWKDDALQFPTTLQISNRRAHSREHQLRNKNQRAEDCLVLPLL